MCAVGAWQAVDEGCLPLRACACAYVCACKEWKDNALEGSVRVVRRRGCFWVCETEERVHEVTSRQLFDFPSFPGKQFQEQFRRETTNHWQLKCHEKKVAVCWWLNYCRCLRLETGEMCEWLHCAWSRHISPTGLFYPSISQHSSQ